MSKYTKEIIIEIIAQIHESKRGCHELPGIVAKGLEEIEQTTFQLRNLKTDLRNLRLEITEKQKLIILVQEACRHYTLTFDKNERVNVCDICGKTIRLGSLV